MSTTLPLESGFDDPTLPGRPEGQRAPCPEDGSDAAPPSGWRCSCGAFLNPNDGAWRWYGGGYEHNHGGQGGYFRATYIPACPPAPPPATWCISSDDEHFTGAFATRELAILEGRAYYGGESFYVGQATPALEPESFWYADAWLDHVSVQDEYLGDWAEGWERSTAEQRVELESLVRPILGAWLDKHGIRPKFFTVLKTEHIASIEEEEDLL